MSAALNWTLLANSLIIAFASTVAAFVFGFAYALAMSALPRLFRQLLLGCAVATLALPSFLVTNSWIDLLGPNGLLREFIPVNIFSAGGAVWILALIMWPIVAIAVFAAWTRLERVHLEVDPALRSASLVSLLLWPTARSLALMAAAVVFALTLGNFAVPAILQIKVYSAEAWVQFSTNLDAAAARRLSWPLVVVPMIWMALIRQPGFPWPRQSTEDFSRTLRRQLGQPLLVGATALSILIGLVALVLPLSQLLGAPRTWSELLPAVQAGLPALRNSVSYAAGAAAVAVALGLLLSPARWLGWLWLLFFAPGILLGISAVDGFNRPGFDWFSRSSGVVISILVIHYLALPRSICRTALREVDTLLLDAAKLEGAAGLTLFRRITWPQIAPQVSAAGYLVYLLCLWDVETILMVTPPGGETLALRIFNLLHYGHNAHVNALCVMLLLTAIAPLVLFAFWKLLERLLDSKRREVVV